MLPILNPKSLANMWDVLALFLIPVGGGIPAGVVMAQGKGLQWPIMMVLYFISDIILACIFEPIALLLIRLGKRSAVLGRVNEAFKKSTNKTIANYGVLKPFTLILISFGVDPMTGRTAAFTAGHGFISGWTLAIAGDMVFFTVLMVSTLWLNSILGDGTMTAIIIMALMVLVPYCIRRIRRWRTQSSAP